MRLLIFLGMTVAFISSAVATEKYRDTILSDTAPPCDLGVLVVTAARTQKPATVETISAKDLEQRGAVTVAEVLGSVPGVSVATGRKNEAGVMVRGISSERVLLMIDGRPVNMPYYGSLDLHALQTDNISYIQITKGTPSLLYGVNGTGGAINIITSRPAGDDSCALSVTTGAGNVGNQRIMAKAMANVQKADFSGTFSRNISDGYKLSERFSSPLGIENGGIRDNSDFDRYSLTGKAGYHFSDNSSAAVSCGYYSDEKGIPSPTDFAQFRRFKKWQRYYADMTGAVLLPHEVNVRSKAYYDNYANEMVEYSNKSLDSMTWDSFHDHWGSGGITTVDLPVGSHTISLGINGKNEVAATQGYMNNPRRIFSMATGSAAIEGHFCMSQAIAFTTGIGMSGAAATDGDGNAMKKQTALSAITGVNAGFLKKGTFHCGIGLYNRYPTLSQLFSEERGNPGLKPETSLNVDIGVGYVLLKNITADVTLFNEDFRELIINYRLPGMPISRYENISHASSRGAESKLSFSVPRLNTDLSLYYTYNATFDYEAKRPLPYVSENSLGSALSILFLQNGRFSLQTQWAGGRGGEVATVFYDGYVTVDGRLTYTWHVLTAAAMVNNLFDADYATEDPAYPSPGRMIRAELSLKLKGKVPENGVPLEKP
jgi:iron complex outermembrane receptor protein